MCRSLSRSARSVQVLRYRLWIAAPSAIGACSKGAAAGRGAGDRLSSQGFGQRRQRRGGDSTGPGGCAYAGTVGALPVDPQPVLRVQAERRGRPTGLGTGAFEDAVSRNTNVMQ